MADEIFGSNRINVVKDGPNWLAWLGPDPQIGLMASGTTPEIAVTLLMSRTLRLGWCWDETWTPR